MTWSGNYVYAPWSASLREALIRHWRVFHIADLEDHPWVDGTRHGLPPGGLLAAEPIAAPKGRHRKVWYGDDECPWRTDATDIKEQRPLLIQPGLDWVPECEEYLLPAEDFLIYLRGLSEVHGVPLMVYDCAMWGGEVETEFAVVYSGRDEWVYAFTGYEQQRPQLVIWYNDHPLQRGPGDVIRRALTHLGIDCPTNYFAPHTRSFNWSRYRFFHDRKRR